MFEYKHTVSHARMRVTMYVNCMVVPPWDFSSGNVHGSATKGSLALEKDGNIRVCTYVHNNHNILYIYICLLHAISVESHFPSIHCSNISIMWLKISLIVMICVCSIRVLLVKITKLVYTCTCARA